MEVQVAVLCDSAAKYENKLSLLGAFDTLVAFQFPVVHPFCSVALRVLFRDGDVGVHKLKIAMIDEDGRDLVPPMEGDIEVRLPEQALFHSQNFVVNLHQVLFPRPGLYSVDVSLDGKVVSSIPLQVIQVAPPPSGSQEKPEPLG